MDSVRSMEHVRWLSDPALRSPVLIAAFTGWNDAGDAASNAVRLLVERWGATAVAEIDPEPFTDFATVRPHVRLEDGHRRIVWPTVGLWSAATAGGDVLLALGPEPALRWRLFTEQFTGIVDRVGVSMAISLGALLADVPHRRPVQVIGTASDREMIEMYDLHPSRYEGPTGIVGVLTDTLYREGVSTASLWAAVPGYAQHIPSPKAATALLERVCAIIGTPPPIDGLAEGAEEYDRRVAALIAADDDLLAYVSRLESMADSDDPFGFEDDGDDAEDDEAGADDIGEMETADPDELVAEVERFLRDQRPDH